MKFLFSLAALTLTTHTARANEITRLTCSDRSALISINVEMNDGGEGNLSSSIAPRLGHGEVKETHAVRKRHHHIGDFYSGPTASLLVIIKTEGRAFAKYSHPGLSGERQELLLECAILSEESNSSAM